MSDSVVSGWSSGLVAMGWANPAKMFSATSGACPYHIHFANARPTIRKNGLEIRKKADTSHTRNQMSCRECVFTRRDEPCFGTDSTGLVLVLTRQDRGVNVGGLSGLHFHTNTTQALHASRHKRQDQLPARGYRGSETFCMDGIVSNSCMGGATTNKLHRGYPLSLTRPSSCRLQHRQSRASLILHQLSAKHVV